MIGVLMTPRLVVNPSTDAEFNGFARDILDDGVVSATEFERRLRVVYPRAVVHARLLSGEPILVWYVYRDGYWVRQGPVSGAE